MDESSPALVALVGVPASGKTTIMREVIRRLGPGDATTFKFKKLKGYYWQGLDLYLLGRYEGEDFDGTDQLPFDVTPDVKAFLQKLEQGVVLFEGDRLTNSTVLQAAPRLHVFTVQPPAHVLRERHNARKQNGNGQPEQWLKGRKTKISNVLERHDVTELPWADAEESASILIQRCQEAHA